MTRYAYFDCFSGASGDMLIGSLLDAGLSLDALRSELARLGLDEYRISVEPRQQHSLTGSKFSVEIIPHAASTSPAGGEIGVGLERLGQRSACAHEHEHEHEPHPRNLGAIEALLAHSSLPAEDVALSWAIFRRLARAEAKVHGTTMNEVHFHEVGAVDSIVDIVGFVIGKRLLGIQRIFCSALPLGGGFVQSAHGRLPVPAPATLEILTEAGAPTQPSEIRAELVTPTGAAILCELAEFRQPALRPDAVGYGFGSRQLVQQANAVRVWLGESEEPAPAEGDTVAELACNLDDMSGEALGFLQERLFEAGALDVWFTPIQMKKNRPAVLLGVLARPADRPRLCALLLEQSSTLGVRWQLWQRQIAGRESVEVLTPWGPAHAKLKRLGGQVVAVAPEYEDCARLARLTGVSLERVYQAVRAAYAGH